jgi:hypothetical protein
MRDFGFLGGNNVSLSRFSAMEDCLLLAFRCCLESLISFDSCLLVESCMAVGVVAEEKVELSGIEEGTEEFS